MAELQVLLERSSAFYENFERKAEMQGQTHYCPGCGHGVAHKLVAEALEELGLQDRTIFVSPVGCSVFGYYYFDTGNMQAAHGRASAVATAAKRSHPNSIVISYQGDGDLAAIGTAEIIHAANRGEPITVFFVNNAIYGMTGGQMAPTTMVGQVTTTTPFGRRPKNEGFPLKVAELLSALEAPAYIERVALNDGKNIMKARKAIRKALEVQRDGKGFSLVEILSPCPTIWKMEPVDARNFVGEKMLEQFPLGVYRDRAPVMPDIADPPVRSVNEVLGLDQADEPATGGLAARHSCIGRGLNIKVAGFGGQGILLLGQIIAEMGMREKLDVSWLPSYGPEMRSGSAHCFVTLAHERIGSPISGRPDVLIAMNELSLRKFGPEVAQGGLILYNRDRVPADFSVEHARIVCVPASNIADELGSAKVANMVILGAFLAETECLPEDSAFAAIRKMTKKAALLELNRKALAAGRRYVVEEIEVGALTQADGFGV